ncbi:hypothetical protein ACFFGF_03705 [Asaia lannensis]|uniref:Uncharacterized protein n=1 Tax=Asaia lannensis NBRC 102526 TaxID=1307926 RepID=A0ABT1CIM7_9PROT|nr:hypothetical protein [Asaia lannensis]MCO6160048.1 hypothetical protein [Asaia lannensis NBRC 102526]GBQ99404.1 hypothetical protein AA102526_1798 [Asaia lannensis NBRC 102526]
MSASPHVPVPVTPPVSGHSRPARSSRLSVRASPDELAAWADTARLLGHETTAHWVRSLLKEAALTGHDGRAVGVSLRKLRGELGHIGNNLNQFWLILPIVGTLSGRGTFWMRWKRQRTASMSCSNPCV